jgi:acyl homoserine lactone synthase
MLSSAFEGFDVSVLRLPYDAHHWNLVYDFLKMRRRVFIEKMNWQLMDANGIEFEQYDIVGVASYVIAHQGNDVLAGARIIRCDMVIGSGPNQYSYMIRDAFFGKIALPSDICDSEPPNDAQSWELTRLASVSKDPAVARAVLDVANDYIFEQDGERCLFLGPPSFLRMAKSYGYSPEKLGKITGDESGRFLAFQSNIIDRPDRVLVLK